MPPDLSTSISIPMLNGSVELKDPFDSYPTSKSILKKTWILTFYRNNIILNRAKIVYSVKKCMEE